MIDEIAEGRSDRELVNAWTTYKDACRDFIFDDTWNEIKTVQSTSDYITISSIEQLDHDMDGYLTVFKLDKASSNSTQTCTLNSIVNELRALLGFTVEPILNRKLLAKGYTYNEAYDQYFFTFKGKTRYIVNATFPRISKERLSPAIKSAQYEILLNRIEEWSDACGAQ